jgi:hypothetical protein
MRRIHGFHPISVRLNLFEKTNSSTKSCQKSSYRQDHNSVFFWHIVFLTSIPCAVNSKYPVLGIMPIKTAEEALAVASDTEYGLHATVFTQDIDPAIHMARLLPCGTVSVNGFSEGDIKTLFGGYKQSGSLARDNGTEALGQYLQTKTIWIQTKAVL